MWKLGWYYYKICDSVVIMFNHIIRKKEIFFMEYVTFNKKELYLMYCFFMT